MEKNQMIEKRSALADEYRKVVEAAKKEERNLSADEVKDLDEMKGQIEKLNDEIRAFEKEEKLRGFISSVPTVKKEVAEEQKSEIRSIYEAMSEKRALTVNGTGASSVVSEIINAMQNKTGLLGKYRFFRGANASTIIPILNPGPAVPTAQSEGATGISSDATAVLGATTVQPKAYVSILPVSAEALLMSGANVEGDLPKVFGESFAKAMLAGSLTGDGTMAGMFTDGSITHTNLECGASGAPKLQDVAKLALQVQDYMDDAVIVINPNLVAGLIAEATTESAPIKAEIMASRSVMGVPLVMTGLAPSTTTAGSVVAVAMSGSNYGVGIANELVVDPIKVKGDTNTYYQATMFFNGKVIHPANGIQLVTV